MHKSQNRVIIEYKVPGSGCWDYYYWPPACLGDSIVASLQHPKGALVAHSDQRTHSQLENHAALKRNEVTNILQDEEPWTIIITVRQVWDNQWVLHRNKLWHIKITIDKTKNLSLKVLYINVSLKEIWQDRIVHWFKNVWFKI